MSANAQQDDEWLDMHLVSGHFLHNHNFFSKQDPYVVMYYNDAAVFKSTTKRSAGSDATWNERIQVRPVAPPHLLSFEVLNKNKLLDDDFIGETKLIDITKRKNGEKTFELKLYDKQNRPKGKLLLNFRMVNKDTVDLKEPEAPV